MYVYIYIYTLKISFLRKNSDFIDTLILTWNNYPQDR